MMSEGSPGPACKGRGREEHLRLTEQCLQRRWCRKCLRRPEEKGLGIYSKGDGKGKEKGEG